MNLSLGIKSIRGKLLLSFLIFVLITCGIVVISLWLNGRREDIARITEQLNQINMEMQRLKRIEAGFLKDETINFNFYNTQESRYLIQHTQSVKSIRESLQEIYQHPEVHISRVIEKIELIQKKITLYEHTFKELQEHIIIRGFKDFGLEGRMRDHIHKIEQLALKYELDMGKLLAIRRIEKDFMIRKEWHYTEDILVAIITFRNEIQLKINSPKENKNLNDLLTNYTDVFQQIAQEEKTIGFSNESGIRNKLTTCSNQVEVLIGQLNLHIVVLTQDLNTQSITTFLFTIVFSVLLLLFFAFFLTQALSRPITNLSKNIHYIIKHNFSKDIELEPIKSKDEIGKLSIDFGFMVRNVQANIQKIQNQSEKIERKQFALMESLRYAQTIQQAILPDADDFNEFFEDYFALYMPMHTVSGDFYWLTEAEENVFLAVVDCTGHGVPGAFMSMVGNAVLTKIVNEKEIFDPSLILSILDIEVKLALKQERDKNNDGMDISLCKFEGLLKKEGEIKLTFSGAKGKVFYTKEGVLHKERSVRRTIGGKTEDTTRDVESFENFEILLPRGTQLYLSTDGFCDQPNQKRKKIGTKKFMEIIEATLPNTMPEQCLALQNALQQHIVDLYEQRDDITVIGVRL